MQEVAVVGAGTLGGLCAHVLARRGAANVVRLIDEHGRTAAGTALDIEESAPVEGFAATVTGTAELSSAAAADAIVIADSASAHAWTDDILLTVIARLIRTTPRAFIVCAAEGSREIVERGVREIGAHRTRLIGTAPEALAAAARAMVALEIGGSPRDVSLTIVGRPPSHVVLPWEDATAHGVSLARFLDEPSRRRVAARVAALWPPGPFALASAAALAVEAVAGRTRRVVSAFVAPDDSLGRKARAVAVPIQLGPAGASPVAGFALDARDQVAFDNARML
jgi:malate dehydrogenase